MGLFHIYKHKMNYQMLYFLLRMLLSGATVLTSSYVGLSPTFFLILTVGSSCSIAYWNQHQSTPNCTRGQYGIWSSCHCYCLHIYIDFCKLLLDHLFSFAFPSCTLLFISYLDKKVDLQLKLLIYLFTTMTCRWLFLHWLLSTMNMPWKANMTLAFISR